MAEYIKKRNVSWDKIKETLDNAAEINHREKHYDDFRYFFDCFEPVLEFPKVELKEQETDFFRIRFNTTITKELMSYEILLKDSFCEVCIYIGKTYLIKSISEFNEKCSKLFGFELIEPCNHEDRKSE